MLIILFTSLLIASTNLYWNYLNEFTTINHTIHNANLKEIVFNYNNVIDFLSSQFFVHLLYPAHEGHEISNWLLGAMTGWFLGASNIEISSNNLVKFFLSLISTSAVFFMMIFLFQLDELVKLSGLMSILYSYSLGLFFSIFVSWIIPRFWKFFNLAN